MKSFSGKRVERSHCFYLQCVCVVLLASACSGRKHRSIADVPPWLPSATTSVLGVNVRALNDEQQFLADMASRRLFDNQWFLHIANISTACGIQLKDDVLQVWVLGLKSKNENISVIEADIGIRSLKFKKCIKVLGKKITPQLNGWRIEIAGGKYVYLRIDNNLIFLSTHSLILDEQTYGAGWKSKSSTSQLWKQFGYKTPMDNTKSLIWFRALASASVSKNLSAWMPQEDLSVVTVGGALWKKEQFNGQLHACLQDSTQAETLAKHGQIDLDDHLSKIQIPEIKGLLSNIKTTVHDGCTFFSKKLSQNDFDVMRSLVDRSAKVEKNPRQGFIPTTKD